MEFKNWGVLSFFGICCFYGGNGFFARYEREREKELFWKIGNYFVLRCKVKKGNFWFEKYGPSVEREQVCAMCMFFTVNDVTEDAETREIERNFWRLKVIFPGHPSIVLLPAITSSLSRPCYCSYL